MKHQTTKPGRILKLLQIIPRNVDISAHPPKKKRSFLIYELFKENNFHLHVY